MQLAPSGTTLASRYRVRTQFYIALACLCLPALAYAQDYPPEALNHHSHTHSSNSHNVVSLKNDGYTVKQFGNAHRIESIRRQLRKKGGVELDSALGTVILYGKSKLLLRRDVRKIHGLLTQMVPRVFQQVNSVLFKQPFPEHLRADNYSWQLFLEPQGRAKSGMLSSERCHAAWMGPPANIFLSVDSFLNSCGSRKSSVLSIEQELHRVLVHEVAHAIEFRLMGKGFARRQRWHSEGFASWFETLSSDWKHESLVSNRELELFAHDWNPVTFTGSHQDYARSYSMISTLVDTHSPETLMVIYAAMDSNEMSFSSAVEAVVGWDLARWNQEARKWLAAQRFHSYVPYLG